MKRQKQQWLWVRIGGYAVFLGFVLGCASTYKKTSGIESEKNPLTHGNVQLTLKKGVTSQAEVLEKFGAPNIATVDADSNEVWTYQRHATVASSSSSEVFGTIILFGGSSRTSGFEQSSRSMTLIIKFDKSKKVSDFKSFYSSF